MMSLSEGGRKLAVIGLVLVLGACSTFTPGKTLTLACGNFGRVLEDLAPARVSGLLGAKDVKRINQAIEVTNPYCLPDSVVPDLKTALRIVEAHVISLALINARINARKGK